MGAPTETEIKLRLDSAAQGLALLAEAGFVPKHERAFEANLVFDTPGRDLLHSRRLLRLRRFRDQYTLTFKGAPLPGPHKSRVELETRVADGAALEQIFLALDYQLLFRYEKYRTTFVRAGESGEAVLDETPVGIYLELEGAPEWIDELAALLGFSREAYILDSYGTLYRQHCERAGVEPTHMVFPQQD